MIFFMKFPAVKCTDSYTAFIFRLSRSAAYYTENTGETIALQHNITRLQPLTLRN